ncbi:hypothetical protein LWC34_43110 [Kibdelosporangium philippinense]|uniref:Uncharacterized protein n=1 Tax=Kibdelosporangium philippinense TaxID=211113 RepID=A0ABS8ZQT1_9PSEU|nr:hypothetical protein [Kibdelosporangium philippinense]MCE7009553.1 hypothetical protein [Kibdelosporangium philippinense]
MREEPRFLATLELVALPTAVAVARMFIADTLRRWDALFIEEHMETVGIELVTLSVEATKPREGTSWQGITELKPIKLRLLGYQRHIVFEVTDAGDEALVLPDDRYADESSGLGLVDVLANRWGSSVTPRGRVNWAEIAVYERTEAGLPKRERRPLPVPPGSTEQPAPDVVRELLQRIRDGLESL